MCAKVFICAKLGKHRLVQNGGAHIPTYITSQVTSIVVLTALESQGAPSHLIWMDFASMYKIGLGLEELMCVIKE